MYIACCCCHSDEDVEEPLDWLPMAPEIEDPEEPGWGQLEVRERREGTSRNIMDGRGGHSACGAGLGVEHASDLAVRSQSWENDS